MRDVLLTHFLFPSDLNHTSWLWYSSQVSIDRIENIVDILSLVTGHQVIYNIHEKA
jgi:hypothetical protein